MPVTVSSNDPRVKIVREEPVTDAGGNTTDKDAQYDDFDMDKIGALSGGKDSPYHLSKDNSWWDSYLSWFGNAFDMKEVDTFNYMSKKMAKKYGVQSDKYQNWAKSILASWYGPGKQSPKEVQQEAKEFALTDFLSAIMNVQTWVRVGESILGIGCIIFGVSLLAKDLGYTNMLPISKLTSLVGKDK